MESSDILVLSDESDHSGDEDVASFSTLSEKSDDTKKNL